MAQAANCDMNEVDESYELASVEAVLAGTLALMTGFAQAGSQCPHRPAMAGKLVANIATLRKELKATKHVSVADKTTGRFAPGKGNARPARNAAPGTKRPANTNDVFALMSKGRDDDAMTKAIAEYM